MLDRLAPLPLRSLAITGVIAYYPCRSYSPRRVRARRGDLYENENVPASSHAKTNGAVKHQTTLDPVSFIAYDNEEWQLPGSVSSIRNSATPTVYEQPLLLCSRGAWMWPMQLYHPDERQLLVMTLQRMNGLKDIALTH